VKRGCFLSFFCIFWSNTCAFVVTAQGAAQENQKLKIKFKKRRSPSGGNSK